MAVDKRELILLRLLALLGTIDGIDADKVFRDRAELEKDELPALILLDGTEERGVNPLSRGARSPSTMVLLPQIFLVLLPSETIKNENVGPTLSAFRVKILKAIIEDQTLELLLGGNGFAEYRSTITDMQTGSTVEGQLQMDFAFTYTFNPTEL